MSAYSASIYSVDESGTPARRPVFAPAPSPSPPTYAASPSYSPAPSPPTYAASPSYSPSPSPPRYAASPSYSPSPSPTRPLFAASSSRPSPTNANYHSSAPPPPPQNFAPVAAAASRPPAIPQVLLDVFAAGKAGDGMKDLSEITVLAEEVISAIEKDPSIGRVSGSIKQMVLHQTPGFVAALLELAEKVVDVAKATRLTEHFKHLELFRVDAALVNTLKVLRAMTAALLVVVWGERKLARHVRVKALDRLGKLHYGIEQLVRGLELLLDFQLTEYNDLLVKVREVRSVLRAQNGVEEPNNA